MSIKMNAVSNRSLMDRFFRKDTPAASGKSDDGNASSLPGPSRPEETTSLDVDVQDVPCRKAPLRNLAIIRSIPSAIHSRHLRRFFVDFVEEAKFACFHFRHRPEVAATPSTSSSSTPSTFCCVIRFHSPEDRADFIEEYHGRPWTDEQGRQIPRRCAVFPIRVAEDSSDEPGSSSSNRLTEGDAAELIELRPPAAMPQGNVGTPSEYFLEQIRACTLPASLIAKLGLKSVRRRRKYDAVPPPAATRRGGGYGQSMTSYLESASAAREESEKIEEEAKEATSLQPPPPSDPTDRALRDNFGPDNDDFNDQDNDECEEWERHEALHDDVTEHERVKERKYEEEMEVTWEKGGPGLVWEMDKAKWDEMEKGTDCDWLWTDDWDVDYSVYYEGKSAGDVDSRQAVEIREDEAKRRGELVESAFRKKRGEREGQRKRRHSEEREADVERYTKRVGSRIMQRMGWTSGVGLGKVSQGRVEPVAIELEEEGQSGRERKGFGYRGEKMQRHGLEKRREVHSIRTIYDDKEKKEFKRSEETGEVLFRRPDKTADNLRTSRAVTTVFKLPD